MEAHRIYSIVDVLCLRQKREFENRHRKWNILVQKLEHSTQTSITVAKFLKQQNQIKK